ncbi:hypothetical protein BJ508DRAFT_323840 [Ascobolus immersus RN42]|uniref:Uncharacterized protein n=1 Tax=Ascobolus immersus RN42 TaxID=1160509 RepID=A0A3N4IHN4_ASCIM|nr:hypothetical protein BJ508DRAFT_323840 [Ascobolus immersus RN42]
MATFLTLPLELHHSIADFLLPPFPPAKPTTLDLQSKDESPEQRTLRLRQFYRHYHDYIPEDSLRGIMDLIIALGPQTIEDEANSAPMHQRLRDLYTTRVCIVLKKTVTTQSILLRRQWDRFQRYAYSYLIDESFLEIHTAFDTIPSLGYKYGRSHLELDFWTAFLKIWDDNKYVVTPVQYERCCLEWLCAFGRVEGASLKRSRASTEKSIFKFYEMECDEDDRNNPPEGWSSGGGTWKTGWEEPMRYSVVEKHLAYFVFCQRDATKHQEIRVHFFHSEGMDPRSNVYARPGLIAALLLRDGCTASGIEMSSALDSSRTSQFDKAYERFASDYFYEEDQELHGSIKELIFKLILLVPLTSTLFEHATNKLVDKRRLDDGIPLC